jgi:hypothetical protein
MQMRADPRLAGHEVDQILGDVGRGQAGEANPEPVFERKDLPDQPGKSQLAVLERPKMNPGEDDLSAAPLRVGSDLVQDLRRRARARGPSNRGNHAITAGEIAALLHLDQGPGSRTGIRGGSWNFRDSEES